MKEVTIKIKLAPFIIAMLLGIYGAMGAFVSLSRAVTLENSPEIDLTNPLMVYARTMYRSFSANRLRTFLFALVIGLAAYLVWQIKRDAKERLLEAVFALLFATMQLIAMIFKKWGGYYAMLEALAENGITAELQNQRLFIKWSAYVLISYFIVALFMHFFHKIAEQKTGSYRGRFYAFREKYIAFSKKKYALPIKVLALALCMFLAWLPYFIYFYPGTSNEDTVIMIMEYNEIPSYIQEMSAVQGDDIFITNHHPYILTIIFNAFINWGLGRGDICQGVAAYVLLQMVILSLIFAGALYYIRSCGVSRKRVVLSLLIIMFLPIFPMYAICMLKDTVYAAFALIFILMMHHVARSHGTALKKVGFVLAIFFVACMMILTKVYAMYILAIVAVIYLIKYKKAWLSTLLSIVLPIILYKWLFCSILLPALGVAPGGIQEALSVPFQQTARYVTEYPEEVTAKEKKAINAILPYKKLAKKYNPELSDPVKKYYNQEATKDDLKAYFKVWWQMFLKHPEVYVESLFHNTYQYYDINKISSLVYYKFNDYLQLHDDDGEYTYLYVENAIEYETQRYQINQLVLFTEKIPVVNIFASIGLWPWLFLFALIYNIKWKRKTDFSLLLVPIVTIAVCMVSPDNGNTRYVMPLLYILPYMIPLELIPEDDKIKDR